ncbi:unnamed protein product [Urochloa humidicola]
MSLAAVATALWPPLSRTAAQQAIPAGSVEAADTVSARGKFELGLFSPGSSGRYYLGIWYKNIPADRHLRVANRASPLSGWCCLSRAPGLSPDDGNLELIRLSRSAASPGVVWPSNLSSSTGSSNVAVIRDAATTATWWLVLADGGNSSNVLWQSFDHPMARWCRRRGSGRTSSPVSTRR